MDRYIRDQIVDKLLAIRKEMQSISVFKEDAFVRECKTALQSILDDCRQGFSNERNAYYAQILNGLADSLSEIQKGTITETGIAEFFSLADELLTFMISSLKAESEVKKEILFLPYKASMWDSLESIWLAAKEDSNCDAYVMPIPYYDLGPNKEVVALHYEGEMFPDYVPITDYKRYDIAKRKPDVIYIHNPYDGYNRVTSVDPAYYSSELKKYTDMLVYVPYFVTNGLFPESHAELSCYRYMDKMIVQNEVMQIQPSGTMEKTMYLRDYIPAEKLVPLGSPKIDRVFYCEEHKQIPVEWEKIIGEKKVVLYNISLSGLLQFGKQALRKMQYIFECFAKNRDVVLLWRPHPLIVATLQSMRPDLYPIYKELEKQFLERKIGILDTTPDIDMAVAIADAYLGEAGSSVVHLFGAVGKPIFITDMTMTKVPDEEEKASLAFWEYCVDREDLWFVADGYNALCRMKLNEGEITPILKFKDVSVYNNGMYGKPLKIGHKIILPPLNANEICEYDLDTKEIKMTPLEEPLDCGNFIQAVLYQHYIFMIPWRYPAILRYDLRNGACTYYAECLEELLSYRTSAHAELFWNVCVRENKILAPCMLTNKVLEFDMESGTYRYYTLGPKDANYAHIVDDGQNYWLLPWTTKSIVKWNYRTGKTKEYHNYPEGFSCNGAWYSGDTYMFSGAAYSNGAIWIFPCFANMILRLDVRTGTIEKVDLPLPYEEYARKSEFYMQQNNYFGVNAYGGHYVTALSAYDRSMLVIDTNTKKCWLIPCRLSPQDVQSLSGTLQESFVQIGADATYAAMENGLWRTVDAFLRYVVSGQHDQQAQKDVYATFIKNMDGTCGEKVHHYILKQIKGRNI